LILNINTGDRIISRKVIKDWFCVPGFKKDRTFKTNACGSILWSQSDSGYSSIGGVAWGILNCRWIHVIVEQNKRSRPIHLRLHDNKIYI
jgi:hypothetical protein